MFTPENKRTCETCKLKEKKRQQCHRERGCEGDEEGGNDDGGRSGNDRRRGGAMEDWCASEQQPHCEGDGE